LLVVIVLVGTGVNKWTYTTAKQKCQQTGPEHYPTDFLHFRVSGDEVHYQTDNGDYQWYCDYHIILSHA
jgi:hypothetical protein